MKSASLLFLSLAAAVFASPLSENELVSDQNVYLLFTRSNPTTAQTLIVDDAASVYNSNFNSSVTTVVMADGWVASGKTSTFVPFVRNALLAAADVNIIVVDWANEAMSDYLTASKDTPDAGRALGRFLDFLNKDVGVPYASMHLVGFDLGAHLVGAAGRTAAGKVARITALDPNKLLWEINPDKLSKTDAGYVEVIHTDSGHGGLGANTNLGHVDFYTDGSFQPGCKTSECNHRFSWKLFALSLTPYYLVGAKCESPEVVEENCRGPPFSVGNNDLTKTGSGTYRISTSGKFPFET